MSENKAEIRVKGLERQLVAEAALAVRLAGYTDISAYLRERLQCLVQYSAEQWPEIFKTERQHPAVRQVLEVLQRGSATVEEIHAVKKGKLKSADIRFALDWLVKHGQVEKRRDFPLDGRKRGAPSWRYSLE